MKLWLVRHAAPQVEDGICYGATDLPADPLGTLECARALAAELPQGASLLASPLQRCEHLRQAACALRADLLHETDARIAEMDFGAWEGRRWDAIGEAALSAWTADFARHRPGGGESVRAFMARVAQAWDETVAARRDAAWITHAGVIRAALLLHRGVRQVDHAAQWPADGTGFGRWTVLQL